MTERSLTSGETSLLQTIFFQTLPYADLTIGINVNELGGERNSITLAMIPRMAKYLWSTDYSGGSWAQKWVFVHEMTHVWQYSHGNSNIRSGIWLWISNGFSYGDSYPYDLASSKDLDDYNMEQQAAIVADYWSVRDGKSPSKHNKGSTKDLATYEELMKGVWGSGFPTSWYKMKAQGEAFKNGYGTNSKYKPY